MNKEQIRMEMNALLCANDLLFTRPNSSEAKEYNRLERLYDSLPSEPVKRDPYVFVSQARETVDYFINRLRKLKGFEETIGYKEAVWGLTLNFKRYKEAHRKYLAEVQS